MTKNRKSALTSGLGLLFVVAVGTGLATVLSGYFSLGSPGTTDYVQYWSAFSALQQGLNPYDGVVLHEIQSTVGQRPDTTILMWNPPWTCLFLAPFLMLPFSCSAALWFLFSVGLLCVISRSTLSCLPDKQHPPYTLTVLSSLLFYPVIECLSWGQLSIFITAAFALTLSLLQRRNFIAAGLSVLPLSLKPHLFFLLLPLGLLLLSRLSRSERRVLLVTACGGMLMTVVTTEWFWPGAIKAWCDSLGGTPRGPGVVPTQVWMTATVATTVRLLLSETYGSPPVWPLAVLPATALVAMSVWVFAKRREIYITPRAVLSTLCLSLLFGNYGWLYDQSLLVPCQLLILCDAYSSNRPTVRYSLIGSVVVIFLTAVLCKCAIQDAAQHHYTWLPAGMLFLTRLAHRLTTDLPKPRSRNPHLLYGSPDPSL